MKPDAERRGLTRNNMTEPAVAVVQDCAPDRDDPECVVHTFVDIHNLSRRGACMAGQLEFQPDSVIDLQIFDPIDNKWKDYRCKVAWCKLLQDEGHYRIGLEFTSDKPSSCAIPKSQKADVADLDFLMSTGLINAVPRNAICDLLNCLTKNKISAGKRFITQGDPGDAMYIIQEGSCRVMVETEGQSHEVAKLGGGDIVGEMAVLTGEPRTAHVEAETDMKLWVLKGEEFELVSKYNPDLKTFLTELVAHRFESSSHSADRVIGRYLIKRRLGVGGYALVYQGVHKSLDMPVAIKMMRHDMAMDEDFIESFRKEARIVANLNHKNIVRVYDIEEQYRTLFIMMEYLEGQSLEALMESAGRLPPARVTNILYQLCNGLAYAHKQGIVHQDVKPDNIFLLPGDEVKILDFGLACPSGSTSCNMAGTVYYMPPEQIEGEQVDSRSDIYALGITAFEMAVGRRPYPEHDLLALEDMHCEEDIPDPGDLVPDLPQALRDFIIKACSRDPEDRFQSAAEAMKALEKVPGLKARKAHSRVRQRSMASLYLFYREHQKKELTLLMEEFSQKAQELGVTIKTADFKGV